MKCNRFVIAFSLALVLIATCAVAAPYRWLCDASDSPPYGQWFKDVNTEQVDDAHFEFYDNRCAPGFPDYPWGGQNSTLAVNGWVTSIMRTPNKNIIAFTMDVCVTNDTYTWLWWMNGTAGSGNYSGSAADIPLNLQTSMYNVRLALDFADAGLSEYPWGQIYTVDSDELAWYGYCPSARPQTVAGYVGDYFVPTYRFGNLAPMQSVTRTISFGLYAPLPPDDPLYNALEASKAQHLDMFSNRTSSMGIASYPSSLFEDDGSAWPTSGSYASDVSVFFDTQPSLGSVYMELGPHTPSNHYWWDGKPASTPSEMIQIAVSAGPDEGVNLETMQLRLWNYQAWEVLGAEAYLDTNGNGQVDPGEALIASGTFEPNDGICALAFSPAVSIGANTTSYVVIAFRTSPAANYWSQLGFEVIRSRATGVTSGGVVPEYGLPVNSCTQTVLQTPVVVSIPQAKQLEMGRTVIIKDKPLTWHASNYYGCIEEPDRSAGIRIDGFQIPAPPSPPEGSAVTTRLLSLLGVVGASDAELKIDVLESSLGDESPNPPITPVAMTNKALGGGPCGFQLGVVDNALTDPPVNAVGLNNVGLLVRTCGVVTCSYTYGGQFWIDDGSHVLSGAVDPDSQQPVTGVAVQCPSEWWWEDIPEPGTYVVVTGIMRCSYNWSYQPARLIQPRDADDVVVIRAPEPQ